MKIFISLILFTIGFQLVPQAQNDSLIQLVKGFKESEKTNAIIELVSGADALDAKEIGYLYNELLDQGPYDFENAKLLGNCFLTLATMAYQDNSYSLAIDAGCLADSLFAISRNIESRVPALLLISKSKRKTGEMEDALEKGELALEVSVITNDTTWYNNILSSLSAIYYHLGDLEKSMEIDYKLVQIYEGQYDSLKTALLYSNIAKTCCDIDDFDNAFKNYELALKIADAIHDSISIGDIYNDLGTLYFHQGNIGKAKEALEKSIQIHTSIDDLFMLALSSLNYGDILIGEGNFQAGIRYLHASYSLFLEFEEMGFAANCLTSLGNAYSIQKDYLKAEYHYKEALKITDRYGSASRKKLLYNELYLFYAKTDRYEEAFKTLLRYKQLVDSIENVEVKNTLLALHTEHETYKKEQEIIQLQQNQIIQNSRRNLLLAIIAIIVFLFVISFGLIFIKRKKDRQLHRQKELYLKKEKQLAEAELEQSRIKEEELQQSILYKSKQLSTHALHMMQKNSLLQDIQKDVKLLSTKVSVEDKPDYKRINFLINQSLRSDKDWDVFKLYFEEVNRDFYHKLNQINTELTTNDHRLCALIKLNMNSKEMASVLNVAPNSIKSSRYRLKKKLELNVEADLEDFIRSL